MLARSAMEPQATPPTRYAIVNAEGKTILEGPKYMLQSLAEQFADRYPDTTYTLKEVY